MSRCGAVCLSVGLMIAAHAAAQAAYTAQVFAGIGCPIGSGSAVTAVLGTANSVALDAAGNIYLSDTDNHLVRKIDTSGQISTLAGTCTAGFSGDGGPATAAQLNQPYDVAVDTAGNVYVADYGNNRVRRIATDGTITTVAGNGEALLGGDGVPAASAPLLTPRNVAVDAAGNIYISEFQGHRVRKVAPNGTITTIAGIGIAGYGGDNGPATAAQLNYPAGLALDSAGALYIADSTNHRVRKVSGGTITTVLGATTSTLVYPVGLAIDSTGTIYVAQGSSGMIGVYSQDAATLTSLKIGPSGSSASANDVAVDASGNLYAALGQQIWKASGNAANRNPVLVAGGGTGIGDGGPAVKAQLNQPLGLALDSAGNLHISDTGNRRIRQVDLAGQISTEAGTGITGFAGDNGPASAAEFASPVGLALDGLGNVYVADAGNNRIRQITNSGLIQTVVGNGQSGLGQEGLPGPQMPLSSPQGVCTDPNGVLYIVDTGNNRVLRAPTNDGVTTAAGNGSQGDTGDGGPAPLAQLSAPTACALDSAGDLFIADTSNQIIRKVTPDGNISTIVGTGAAAFSGDGGPATAAALSGPTGIAVTDDGNIYISDSNNHRVRKVTPDGVIQTIAGDEAVPLGRPAGLALDGSGNLYVADSANSVVLKLTPGSGSSGTQGTGTPTPSSLLAAVSAASGQAGTVAPGELISIYGLGLGPQTGVTATLDSAGMLPTSLGGTEVQFDGTAAPILYTQTGQVNAQVPYSVTPGSNTNIVVLYNGPAGGHAGAAGSEHRAGPVSSGDQRGWLH
jgi:trimeric autotransporter adhesin